MTISVGFMVICDSCRVAHQYTEAKSNAARVLTPEGWAASHTCPVCQVNKNWQTEATSVPDTRTMSTKLTSKPTKARKKAAR